MKAKEFFKTTMLRKEKLKRINLRNRNIFEKCEIIFCTSGPESRREFDLVVVVKYLKRYFFLESGINHTHLGIVIDEVIPQRILKFLEYVNSKEGWSISFKDDELFQEVKDRIDNKSMQALGRLTRTKKGERNARQKSSN